jgi:hypothetical protein
MDIAFLWEEGGQQKGVVEFFSTNLMGCLRVRLRSRAVVMLAKLPLLTDADV